MLKKLFCIIVQQTKNEMNTIFYKTKCISHGLLAFSKFRYGTNKSAKSKNHNQYNKQVLTELEQTFSTKAKKRKKEEAIQMAQQKGLGS